MKRSISCVVVALYLFFTAPSARAGVFWMDNFAAARIQAQATGKPLLVYFGARNLSPGLDMTADFASVDCEMATRKFVCVTVNAEDPRNAQLIRIWGVHGGNLVLCDNNARPLSWCTGKSGPKDRVAQLENFSRGWKNLTRQLIPADPLPAGLCDFQQRPIGTIFDNVEQGATEARQRPEPHPTAELLSDPSTAPVAPTNPSLGNTPAAPPANQLSSARGRNTAPIFLQVPAVRTTGGGPAGIKPPTAMSAASGVVYLLDENGMIPLTSAPPIVATQIPNRTANKVNTRPLAASVHAHSKFKRKSN